MLLYRKAYKLCGLFNVMIIPNQNNLSPEQRTRALYAHRIAAVVESLAETNPVFWRGVHASDGRLVNATRKQANLLQDRLRAEFDDPKIVISVISRPTKSMTATAYSQQSYLTFVWNLLEEFYAGNEGQTNYRRAVEAIRTKASPI